MKKLTLLLAVLAISTVTFGQAKKYLNFGGLGTGLYASVEFPLGNLITIAPMASTNYNFNNFVIGVKANFYFDDLFGLTEPWDVYAGIGSGWRVDNSDNGDGDGFDLGAQIGARWFWNDKWGLNGEFGWSRAANGGLGVTMKL